MREYAESHESRMRKILIMIVIHPIDQTTAALSKLYEGMEDVVRLNQTASNQYIKHTLNHSSSHERIYLLGHGSDSGLFSRMDDTKDEFDRLIVNHSHAYYLRKHNCNIIGIWCHADLFARKEGLHGLFSGMIISDKREAEEYGIITLQHHIDESCGVMFAKLRKLLDDGVPLHEIPERMRALKGHSLVDSFNYENFYYL